MIAVFRKMSASERRLAIIAAACLVAFILFIGYRSAMDRLNTMDALIESLQQELLAYTELANQAETVNNAFEAIAAQHSSQWTQEEIHDRLRKEITRLALRQVPAPGTPIPAAASAGDVLVSIPQMPLGSLVDNEAGYRSYQINFKTEPAPIQNITLFIERLQRSDQALRIDSLEVVRQPLASVATATIRVTRTVIDDVPGSRVTPQPTESPPVTGDLIANAGLEEWDDATGAFPGWTAEDCTVKQVTAQATEGKACLRAEEPSPTGSVYQTVSLTAGRTYDLEVDAYAWGTARLLVADEATGQAYEVGQPLVADATPYRYRMQFTVEGEPGNVVPIRVPVVVLEGKGAAVVLDNVSLNKVMP